MASDPTLKAEASGDDNTDSPNNLYYRRSYFSEVFAVIICVLYFSLLAVFAWHPIPAGSNETVLNVMVGTVAGSFATVVGYFFGSTIGSRSKDLLLLNSTVSKTRSDR